LPEQPEKPLMLAFGNERPPTPKMLTGDSAPLVDLEAIYPRPLQKRQFWTPLAAVGGPSWDFGWLGVYILAYLAAMLIAKRLMGIP
jgi:hypothetical protein